MNASKDDDRYVYLRSMFTRIVRNGAETGERTAEQVADAILSGLMAEVGGQRIYIPSEATWRLRRAAIKQAFDGANIIDLCSRFGVSRSTVYRDLARKTEERL
jgi:Mor family transcriptional regulator